MTSQLQAPQNARDLLARPASALVWWGLPLVAGVSVGALPIVEPAKVAVWAAALAWMGVGCTLNVLRCHRLHCYFAAPVMFIGAFATAATAVGFQPFGDHTGSYVINGSLALALLTFAVEPTWGKYRPH